MCKIGGWIRENNKLTIRFEGVTVGHFFPFAHWNRTGPVSQHCSSYLYLCNLICSYSVMSDKVVLPPRHYHCLLLSHLMLSSFQHSLSTPTSGKSGAEQSLLYPLFFAHYSAPWADFSHYPQSHSPVRDVREITAKLENQTRIPAPLMTFWRFFIDSRPIKCPFCLRVDGEPKVIRGHSNLSTWETSLELSPTVLCMGNFAFFVRSQN